ncbi:reverse transcriptase domain-containing protein [Tanacetum coccineum]
MCPRPLRHFNQATLWLSEPPMVSNQIRPSCFSPVQNPHAIIKTISIDGNNFNQTRGKQFPTKVSLIDSGSLNRLLAYSNQIAHQGTAPQTTVCCFVSKTDFENMSQANDDSVEKHAKPRSKHAIPYANLTDCFSKFVLLIRFYFRFWNSSCEHATPCPPKSMNNICLEKTNEATEKTTSLYHSLHLPFMDQMLERLAGNEYYCFLDGFSGYFQIPIDPKDQEKTTFTCPYGTFAYRRMPFGLCNAPGTFQRCMMAIFHDMIEKTMEVFMDDFSVFGDSFNTCLTHLEKMLKRCEDTNLSLNWEKSHFMVKEGIVLGHKISKSGLEVDRAKVEVIAKLPHPTSVKGVLRFNVKLLFSNTLPVRKTPFFFSEECIDPLIHSKKNLTGGSLDLNLLPLGLAFELMVASGRLMRWIYCSQEFGTLIRVIKRAVILSRRSSVQDLKNPHKTSSLIRNHEAFLSSPLGSDCSSRSNFRHSQALPQWVLLLGTLCGQLQQEKSSIQDSIGPPSTRMPMTLSPVVTFVNVKEKLRNVMRCHKTPSKFAKSLTSGALILWGRFRLQEEQVHTRGV